MFDIKSLNEPDNNITAISFSGDIDYVTYPDMKKLFMRLTADEKNKFIIDLNKVTYIDSSGLGSITSLHIKTSKNGGFVKIISTNPEINKILKLTGLSKVIPVYENLDEALAVK